MINIYKIKIQLNWPLIRAHICTVAVALSFNSTWRVPRDAFRYGGVVYGLVFTLAMVTVAFPIALFQLSVGQLSQQDAVGIWRAVPFFKGVGYLRLLITFLASVYTITYVGITTTIFFYSLNNSVPFSNSQDAFAALESNDSCLYNTSCVNGTILAPVQEHLEHYMAMALITSVLWVLFPIILYSPVKFMRNTFYGAVPVLLVLAVTVLSYLGDKDEIGFIYESDDWINLKKPEIWHSTIIQALWSTQIAGGFLISVGDTVYSSTDVQWTALVFVVVNILASWFGLILWYAIGGSGEKDTSVLAILEQTYKLYEEKNLSAFWPPLIFALLIASGVVTALTLLYPLYERFKRISGCKWRYLAAGSSLVGVGAALGALASGLPALTVLDDTVVPFLISITTIFEICPFLFIYGWRIFIEDIEFLVGRDITKYWMWGWCAAIGIILSSTVWWLTHYFLNSSWEEPTWVTTGTIVAAGLSLAIIIIFATISVIRQVQYDVIGKLKSSFKPSRHWGPRDPITHYYWMARRRDDVQRDQPRMRYNRRQLGQFSGDSSFLKITSDPNNIRHKSVNGKRRSNSDDWIYNYRKQHLAEVYQEYKLNSTKRSKSLDLTITSNLNIKDDGYRKELNMECSEITSVVSGISVTPNNNQYVKHM